MPRDGVPCLLGVRCSRAVLSALHPIEKPSGRLTFLYALADGAADQSYGRGAQEVRAWPGLGENLRVGPGVSEKMSETKTKTLTPKQWFPRRCLLYSSLVFQIKLSASSCGMLSFGNNALLHCYSLCTVIQKDMP